MSRFLRIPATMLMLAIVAFLFSACGGSDQSAAPPPVSHTTSLKSSSSTDKPENLIGTVIAATDQSPQDFKSSLASRRPVVVLFYMTGPTDDNQVRSSIETLESRYKGDVDFYTYLYTDAQAYGDLTSLLKVDSTPSVIMINKQSKVQRAWSGYVDEKSLEQGVSEIMSG